MEKILSLYQEKFCFKEFYNTLLQKIKNDPITYTDNLKFLFGYQYKENSQTTSAFDTKVGDIRVDLPVWFGNINTAQLKIMILGLEPRDTHKNFNIERVEKYVFATPFALELQKNKYTSALMKLLNHEKTFIYFSDIVKTYDVTKNKEFDDKLARKNFSKRASLWHDFILKEIALIQPDLIIGLGNDSYNFLDKNLHLDNIVLKKIRHPSYGGAKIAEQQIHELLKTHFPNSN
ncbi:hypothetical protein MMG00_01375 [Ignatzschineria rhizosphaerae]|uniref:Uracil-DNA glycosylase-like domain-containing protein n=1 Tax=Ignatzschineria rhizosphaerae TaxID=2923279 RepID=A0ABY3X734_9GAMM|nr:uracil-DNA glycosylase family protein [Ignatzschineria rhizosphaerae]UNM96541.1 hypothetical protein MMG00_01375 [Ignatzschineria rhizosphaerae]